MNAKQIAYEEYKKWRATKGTFIGSVPASPLVEFGETRPIRKLRSSYAMEDLTGMSDGVLNSIGLYRYVEDENGNVLTPPRPKRLGRNVIQPKPDRLKWALR